ncbi:MAG: hypothetical protein V5A20_04350 [Salinibacter sp.]|uniref:Bor/Iss family lipoprotein n=1 Tax=Salinibacter sp. TaxID=2065818 RepID=UPI002FC2F24D
MKYLLPVLLAVSLLVTGCYQARMTTGKDPSDTVVEKKWASSFIYGLVPARVDVSQECSNGIASAERKFSFPNMLVNTLTLGIYLPQSVRVTCAAQGSMSATTQSPANVDYTVPAGATQSELRSVLNTATIQSSITQKTTQVHITSR